MQHKSLTTNNPGDLNDNFLALRTPILATVSVSSSDPVYSLTQHNAHRNGADLFTHTYPEELPRI